MVPEWIDSGWGRELRVSVEAIAAALAAAAGLRRPVDIPSAEETRALLGLFARLPSEDVRQAVLGLMRVVVEADA